MERLLCSDTLAHRQSSSQHTYRQGNFLCVVVCYAELVGHVWGRPQRMSVGFRGRKVYAVATVVMIVQFVCEKEGAVKIVELAEVVSVIDFEHIFAMATAYQQHFLDVE